MLFFVFLLFLTPVKGWPAHYNVFFLRLTTLFYIFGFSTWSLTKFCIALECRGVTKCEDLHQQLHKFHQRKPENINTDNLWQWLGQRQSADTIRLLLSFFDSGSEAVFNIQLALSLTFRRAKEDHACLSQRSLHIKLLRRLDSFLKYLMDNNNYIFLGFVCILLFPWDLSHQVTFLLPLWPNDLFPSVIILEKLQYITFLH